MLKITCHAFHVAWIQLGRSHKIISDLFRAIRNLNINVLGKLTRLCSRTRLGVAVLVMMWLACHGTSP